MTDATPVRSSRNLNMPARLGDFELIGPLGHGRQGLVYRGRHCETRQLVAIKTVPSLDEALLASLRREIHTLTKLRHPNVVRVVDHGVADGLPWLAMHLVEGVDLVTYARRFWDPKAASSPPTTAAVAEIFGLIRQTCVALAYLHGEGVIHRDVKPANILVDECGRLVLVDFGFTVRVGDGAHRDALASSSSGGTLGFVAPERVLGADGDARSDLFSVGVLLFLVLVGELPFPTSQALVEARLPLPPSALVPGLDPAVDQLVADLLAKDPRRRLGHADLAAQRLVEVGAGPLPLGADYPTPKLFLYRPSFIGRVRLCAALVSHFGEATRSGRGGLCVVSGESGVGKTRLVSEVARRLDETGVLVVAGECADPAHALPEPFSALRSALRTVADRCRVRGPKASRAMLQGCGRVLGAYEPSLLGVAGDVDASRDWPPHEARGRVLAAVTSTLLALTHEGPLLLLIDDLPWADPLSLDWFEYLLDSGTLGRHPLHILATARTGETPARVEQLLARPEVRRVVLSRLEPPDVADLATDMLAHEPPQALLDALTRHTEGNPFFVGVYLHAAVNEGILRRSPDGTWVVDPALVDVGEELSAMSMPERLRATVVRRLRALGTAAREVADWAALLGRESGLDMIWALVGREDLGAVSELLTTHVIEPSDRPVMRFGHAKLQECLVDLLEPGRRATMHRAIAICLEARFESHGTLSDDIGAHWVGAGDGHRAWPWFQRAARTAADAYDLSSAVRLLECALAQMSDASAIERGTCWNQLGRIQLDAGVGTAALASTEFALAELAPGGADTSAELTRLVERGHSHYLRANCRRFTGDFDAAAQDFERAGTFYQDANRPADLARQLNRFAGLRHMQSRFDDALQLLTKALRLSREIGDVTETAVALFSTGLVYWHTNRAREALGAYAEALALQRSVGDRRGEAMTLSNICTAQMDLGELDNALATAEDALALHRAVGNRLAEGQTMSTLGVVFHVKRDYHAALTWLRESMKLKSALNNERSLAITLTNLGLTETAIGALADAETHFAEARTVHHALQNRRSGAYNLTGWAALRRLVGDVEGAADRLTRAGHLLSAVQPEHGKLRGFWACEQGHLALAVGSDPSAWIKLANRCAALVRAGPRASMSQRRNALVAAAGLAETTPERLFRGADVDGMPSELKDALGLP